MTIRRFALPVALVATLSLGACADLNDTQRRAALGAGGGAVVGALVGAHTGCFGCGAAIGAAVGGATGFVYDLVRSHEKPN